MKYYLGFDCVSFLKDDISLFLSFVKLNHISFYSLEMNNELCTCFIPLYYRPILKKYNRYYIINYSIGLFSYFLLFFKKIERIIFILSICLFLSFFSLIIFDIKIDGLDSSLNRDIRKTINNHSINILNKQPNYSQLNDLLFILKDQYKNKIEYINIYKRGSSFHLNYIKRSQSNKKDYNYKPIYAKESGIISSIDIKHGLIKVKVNDYVSKGDLLVDNNIISTNNKTTLIPVEGNIFAYTFKTLSASTYYNGKNKEETIYRLLFEIRKQLPLNAKIDKENVLQIEVKHSRINIVMHYTLIEDITLIGDSNERNN